MRSHYLLSWVWYLEKWASMKTNMSRSLLASLMQAVTHYGEHMLHFSFLHYYRLLLTVISSNFVSCFSEGLYIATRRRNYHVKTRRRSIKCWKEQIWKVSLTYLYIVKMILVVEEIPPPPSKRGNMWQHFALQRDATPFVRFSKWGGKLNYPLFM